MIRLGRWIPLAALLAAPPLAAQQPRPWASVAAQAIPVLTESDAVPGGRSYGEARLVQPVVMLDAGAFGDRLLLFATADFEGLTMPNAELTPGAWGEGFIDRRHPHTYAHELMLVAPDFLAGVAGAPRLSLGVGKGFVPFGSDDPMSRPTERFPVNHHLSQILERGQVYLGVHLGGASLAGALFDGDEPQRADQWPNLRRFGDSWSLRLTLRPAAGLEWQASNAFVKSPEHREGSGVDSRKWSTSLRWERTVGGRPLYALAEWARTSEAGGAFVFHTLLLESELRLGPHRPYLRFERTERPEEQRTLDPYRLVRPPIDNALNGITRWTIWTAGYGADVAGGGRLHLRPFVEGSLIRIARVGGGVFNPDTFYGPGTHWSVTTGVRLGWGMMGHRMGRYEPMTGPGAPTMRMGAP
ncbi:MAG TPA: hypothetical protein VI160_04100 [Gemmatimonadales bacterium]